MTTVNGKFKIEDGKLVISSKVTVHDCMDFFHGVKDGCTDSWEVKWAKNKCLVRANMNKPEFTLKTGATSFQVLRPVLFGTVTSYGVSQFGLKTNNPADKLEMKILLAQASSNYDYALLYCIFRDSDLLKKTIWNKDETYEEYVEQNNIVDPRPHLRAAHFKIHPENTPFPLHVARITISIMVWVDTDNKVAKADRPKKRLGVSCYRGGPYKVVEGTIVSNYIKFASILTPKYAPRIDPHTKMISIEQKDFANLCVKFVASNCIYSAAQSSEKDFPAKLQYSMKTTTFDMTFLSETVDSNLVVNPTEDDLEEMRALGATIPADRSGEAVQNSEDESSEH